MVEMPHIDLEKCNGCGLCIGVCNNSTIVIKNGKVAIVETAYCGWCALCEAVCSEGAITCPYDIVSKE